MTKNNDPKENTGKNLVLFAIIFWLGVLTGAVVALMYIQTTSTADLKSNVFYAPIKYSIPETFKPGPDPWMPSTIYLNP